MQNKKQMLKTAKKIKKQFEKANKIKTNAANLARDVLLAVELPQCLMDDMKKAECSKDLTSTSYDDYLSQWVRLSSDSIDFIEELRSLDSEKCFTDALQDTVRDDGFRIDFENDCLTYGIGPAIIVSHERSYLLAYDQDSSKVIAKIENSDECQAILYAEIEAWMEKAGYFPSTVFADRHGNYSYINTLEYKKGAA